MIYISPGHFIHICKWLCIALLSRAAETIKEVVRANFKRRREQSVPVDDKNLLKGNFSKYHTISFDPKEQKKGTESQNGEGNTKSGANTARRYSGRTTAIYDSREQRLQESFKSCRDYGINTYFSRIANCQICNIAASQSLPIYMTLLSRIRRQKVSITSRKSATCCLLQQKCHLRKTITLGWFAFFAESSAIQEMATVMYKVKNTMKLITFVYSGSFQTE